MSIFNSKAVKIDLFALIYEMIVMGAACLLVLFVLEGILHTFKDFDRFVPGKVDKRTASGDYIHYGQPWRILEFSPQIIKLDKNGYRSHGFNSIKGKNTRIAVIGDSFVGGYQLPLEETFVSKAQSYMKRTQLLPLGKDAQYFPRQYKAFVNAESELFGLEGQYPPVDAYIFSVGRKGLMHLAYGIRDMGVSRPPFSWRFKLKEPIVKKLSHYLKDGTRSKFHSESLLAFKIYKIINEGLKKDLPHIDEERFQWSKEVLKNEVIVPMIKLSVEREIPIGLLYLPRVEEITFSEDHIANQWKRLTLEAIEETGLAYVNAESYLKGQADVYFPYDKHANAKGHHFLSLALKDLILKIYPTAR